MTNFALSMSSLQLICLFYGIKTAKRALQFLQELEELEYDVYLPLSDLTIARFHYLFR